jgi:hypothetical protein
MAHPHIAMAHGEWNENINDLSVLFGPIACDSVFHKARERESVNSSRDLKNIRCAMVHHVCRFFQDIGCEYLAGDVMDVVKHGTMCIYLYVQGRLGIHFT